jgi:glycyl-tRNA synthetase beta chain
MRWGDGSFEYARPIHWVIALFGNQPVEFEVAGIMTKNITYGHRFLSTGPIEINNPFEYIEKLRLNGVFVKEGERMGLIKTGIKGIEEKVGGSPLADDELIKEIIYITEYPYPLMGGFDKAYLSLPKEVLINVMKGHQRYIPIEDDDNKLLPVFICFANIRPKDDKVVIKGNEKVLKARLADAIFFFEEDKRLPLYGMYDRLSNIVFHERLGTLKEKVERVSKIATYLVRSLDLGDEQRIKQAARLMKTDLLTHMVGEFPELQGTMGRIYALSHGEDAEVAYAIEEHYLPSGITSALPQTRTGTILSIADKIDTLTSFFSVGIVPTGNLDPFALRRQAIGLIKIVIDKGLHIKLRDLIMVAYEAGAAIQDRSPFEDVAIALSDFISTRFKFSMIEDNHRQEFIESILPWVEMDIYDGYLRLIALENQSSMDDFKRLLIGFKRAYNITKSITDEKAIEPKLFKEEAEHRLYNLYESLKGQFFSHMQERRYEDGLSILVSFKETVDDYFDKVFVMDKDEVIRDNRLALLKRVKDLFMSFGDFSRIHME